MYSDERYNVLMKKFIALDREHHRLLEREVGASGMHRSQHAMLLYIKRCSHAPTQQELAELLLISPAAVAVTMKKLENAGYIERKSDENDSRRNSVSLTEKGEEILTNTKKLVDAVDRRMFEGFSPEEYEVFTRCLDKMQKNLSEFEKEKKNEEMV